MAKTKKAKINQPKRIKGGSVVGKEGEIWFALKCLNFNSSFKQYIASACKDFFEDEEETEVPEEQ